MALTFLVSLPFFLTKSRKSVIKNENNNKNLEEKVGLYLNIPVIKTA
jgi:hypothetical protein